MVIQISCRFLYITVTVIDIYCLISLVKAARFIVSGIRYFNRDLFVKYTLRQKLFQITTMELHDP